MSTVQCPALLVSAPASGQGKTLVTAALARRHRNAGRRVRVFKCGPDFLDPMILEQASGAPVYQLDLFMCGENECRRLLHEAAQEADLILVEGVMGLFDGTPSAADLSIRFGLPVLAVLDGSAMAQSFGALVHGLATYREDMNLVAALGNRVGGERHAAMLAESLPSFVQWMGPLASDAEAAFPERHLGLVQAEEIAGLDARIDRAAAALSAMAEWLPPPVAFAPPAEVHEAAKSLAGVRIAIARDAAFGFIYPANLDCLKALGAELRFFSPLDDAQLPECDALWLPGGYPELHLPLLGANQSMKASIRAHHAAEKPIFAECGGMLFCVDELSDSAGQHMPMSGLMTGRAAMQPRLSALGLQSAHLPHGPLRGHTFHYSTMQTPLTPAMHGTRIDGSPGEAVYRHGSLTATYLHFYFNTSPETTASLFAPLRRD